MTVQLARKLYSVQEYYRMAEVDILTPDDKVELIKGDVIFKSPVGKRHAFLVDQLNMLITTEIGRKVVVRIQNPITIGTHSEPEPDIVVAKLPREVYRDEHHPFPADIHFIIEVADSTLGYDKEIKLPLYAEAGILIFWIVNVNKEEIEVYEQPENGKYARQTIYRRGDQLPIQAFDIILSVDDIFGS